MKLRLFLAAVRKKATQSANQVTVTYNLESPPGTQVHIASEYSLTYEPAYTYTQSSDVADLSSLSVPILTQEITSDAATLPLQFTCFLYGVGRTVPFALQIIEFQIQFARDPDTGTWTVTTSDPALNPASNDWTITGVSVNSDSCTVSLQMPSQWGNTSLYYTKAKVEWVPIA